jgi:hypothetical protein
MVRFIVTRGHDACVLQDVASMLTDLHECDRRLGLVASLLQRNADESVSVATSAASGASAGAVHPLLVAVQANLEKQGEEAHELYAQACRGRDELLDGGKVRCGTLPC